MMHFGDLDLGLHLLVLKTADMICLLLKHVTLGHVWIPHTLCLGHWHNLGCTCSESEFPAIGEKLCWIRCGIRSEHHMQWSPEWLPQFRYKHQSHCKVPSFQLPVWGKSSCQVLLWSTTSLHCTAKLHWGWHGFLFLSENAISEKLLMVDGCQAHVSTWLVNHRLQNHWHQRFIQLTEVRVQLPWGTSHGATTLSNVQSEQAHLLEGIWAQALNQSTNNWEFTIPYDWFTTLNYWTFNNMGFTALHLSRHTVAQVPAVA
jgi:hypothetical protein